MISATASPYRQWCWAIPVALVGFQVATPTPEVGPGELIEFWPLIVRIGWFLVGLLAVVLLNRFLIQPVLVRILRQRNRNNPTLRNAVLRYFQLVVIVVAILVGASVAGYSVELGNSALLLSAIALAIGLAAQEVVGSLVSGVALVLDPDFNVGDYIEWPNGSGVVQSIALRTTRVKTLDGTLVTIPNTILTSNEVSRPFGRGRHRVVQQFGIGYEDGIDEAITQLEDVAASFDAILTDPAPVVYVDKLGGEVTIHIHYWLEDPTQKDILAIKSNVARRIKRRFENEGITLSPPSEHELSGRIDIDDSGRTR